MTHALTEQTLDLEAVRRDFPILGKPLPDGSPLIYLDNGATAQKPRVVIDKIVEVYENYYANVHRGIHSLGDRVTVELENSREKIRRFIGAAQPEEILFTSGTTAAINLVAYGWGRKFLKAGDEVLLTEMEHHANLVPWQFAAQQTGAKLRFIPLAADGQLDLSRLDEVLTERTKIVAITGMSNVLGTIPPVGEIVDRAHARGAVVLVDGAQSIPHLPVNVRDPDIDFLAFSGHKLYGPSGVGVLYGKRKLLARMDPLLGGGNMINEVFRDTCTFAEPPAKFEAGTLPIVPAIALGSAVDYVLSLGFPAIHAQEQKLTELALEKLSRIPGTRVLGPDLAQRGSIVSFTVEGVHPHDLADLLNRRGVAIRAGHHCTMPLHEQLGISATARASFAFYNTTAEIEALAEAIQYARQVFRLA
jgi:cysteine desulfurase/selenocysteine lyase